MTEQKLWYAVTVDNENEWGLGSYDYEAACDIADEERDRNKASVIRLLTIDDGVDPVCINEAIVHEPDMLDILMANGWNKGNAISQIAGNGAWLDDPWDWYDVIEEVEEGTYGGAELIDYDGRQMVLVTPL